MIGSKISSKSHLTPSPATNISKHVSLVFILQIDMLIYVHFGQKWGPTILYV